MPKLCQLVQLSGQQEKNVHRRHNRLVFDRGKCKNINTDQLQKNAKTKRRQRQRKKKQQESKSTGVAGSSTNGGKRQPTQHCQRRCYYRNKKRHAEHQRQCRKRYAKYIIDRINRVNTISVCETLVPTMQFDKIMTLLEKQTELMMIP